MKPKTNLLEVKLRRELSPNERTQFQSYKETLEGLQCRRGELLQKQLELSGKLTLAMRDVLAIEARAAETFDEKDVSDAQAKRGQVQLIEDALKRAEKEGEELREEAYRAVCGGSVLGPVLRECRQALQSDIASLIQPFCLNEKESFYLGEQTTAVKEWSGFMEHVLFQAGANAFLHNSGRHSPKFLFERIGAFIGICTALIEGEVITTIAPQGSM